jgi:hypothetical protein
VKPDRSKKMKTHRPLPPDLVESLRTLRYELQGVKAPPAPTPEPEAEVIPLNPWRYQRWTAEPTGPTSYRAIEPTSADAERIREEELREQNARAARWARLEADPLGLGIWAHETMADLVRRQED